MLLEINPTPEQMKLLILVLLILCGYHRDTIMAVMG